MWHQISGASSFFLTQLTNIHSGTWWILTLLSKGMDASWGIRGWYGVNHSHPYVKQDSEIEYYLTTLTKNKRQPIGYLVLKIIFKNQCLFIQFAKVVGRIWPTLFCCSCNPVTIIWGQTWTTSYKAFAICIYPDFPSFGDWCIYIFAYVWFILGDTSGHTTFGPKLQNCTSM